jgi:hypothetical protein
MHRDGMVPMIVAVLAEQGTTVVNMKIQMAG